MAGLPPLLMPVTVPGCFDPAPCQRMSFVRRFHRRAIHFHYDLTFGLSV